MTEIEKAKFQNPFTYNDERNFVEHNAVKKISDDLVYLTKDTSSASILSELEEREETLEGQPVHIVTLTCERLKTLSRPGLVDDQYKVELSHVFKS